MKRITGLLVLGAIVMGGFLALPSAAHAQSGVGINLSEIAIDEALAPGGIYKLPMVTVTNTGSEAGEYALDVAYVHNQKEERPPKEWFSFKPEVFHLEPKTSQVVAISLTIPVKARPGEYFAFIQAKGAPTPGGVSIAVAAATKLRFDVRPANLLVAVTTRVQSFFQNYSPGSYIGVGLLGLAIVIAIIWRFFRIRFRVERK